MKIFVHRDELYGDKWHKRYLHVLSHAYGIETVLIDFLTVPLAEIAPLVSSDDGLIGRWGHVPADVQTFGARYDALATLFSGRIFPSPQAHLYYDNKFRQASLFLNRGYPTPPTAVVHSRGELDAFLARESLAFPIVVKSSHGAQSAHVGLLLDASQAVFPCLAQRYCLGNDGDYRVCVIGHRVMGFMRRNRTGDFRASGSGRVVHLNTLDPELIALASHLSLDNHFESMAYDFIRLKDRWVVLEMSYTYPHWSLRDCPFYYDTRSGCRLTKTGVYPEDFIVEDFLGRYYPHIAQLRTPRTATAQSHTSAASSIMSAEPRGSE